MYSCCRKGDHILEVNAHVLYQATIDEAYNVLGNLQPGTVRLKIKRKKNLGNANLSKKSSLERPTKAKSDCGDNVLAKWGNMLDLRTPSKPAQDGLADLMTPARHLTGK